MEKFNLIATTTFGLEAIVKRELQALGYEDTQVSDGRVKFSGDMRDVARTNMWLRTADRVLIEIASFKAMSFEELFDKTYDIDWVSLIPEKANFIVDGRSKKSKLFSISDSQRIVEKAIIEKLKTKYKIDWFEKSGSLYKLEVALLNDIATITLDTTGPSLHKRGYRDQQGSASIKETLASAMVQLSYWNEGRMLYDPFCGSGTILIEAGMLAKNIAPGLDRDFSFTHWDGYDSKLLKDIRVEAYDLMKNDIKLELLGSDIDGHMIEIAKSNADNIGLDEDIIFLKSDFRKVRLMDDYGVLISNPPYGMRIGSHSEVDELAIDLGAKMRELPTWSSYIISSDEEFEKKFGKAADRKRKLYNGKIKVDYYQYYGPRPGSNK